MDRGNGLEVIGWANTVAGQVVWSVHRIAQPWADVALIALRFTGSHYHRPPRKERRVNRDSVTDVCP